MSQDEPRVSRVLCSASHVAVDKQILVILAKFTTPAIPADAPLVSQKLCIFADLLCKTRPIG